MKLLTCQCIRTLSEITSAEHCLFCCMCPRILDFSQGWIQDWWGLKFKQYGGDFFKFLFCSSIVDLQCCVNFCCTAKWSSYTYRYILVHSLFQDDLSQDIEYSFLCYTASPFIRSLPLNSLLHEVGVVSKEFPTFTALVVSSVWIFRWWARWDFRMKALWHVLHS